MSQPNGFFEQYKENVRASNRMAPWRLLRLVVAFGLTLLLAPCCAVAAAITGEPMAAMVVAVVGIFGVVIVWRSMLWLIDRSKSSAPAANYSQTGFAQGSHWPQPHVSSMPGGGQSPFASQGAGAFPPSQPGYSAPITTHAGFVQPAYAAQLPGQPILGASTGPVPPFATEPPAARSGTGCTIAAVALIGFMFLSCCGGGVAILATLPNFKMQVGPQQPMAGPAVQPFGFPDPLAGPPGAVPGDAFGNNDVFEEMRRAQEKSMQELIEEHNRQMEQFDEEFRKQNEAFRPGF
jgi:hypothetical protein